MSDEEEESLSANFFYNSMLARALLQIIPAKDRVTVRAWLEKLIELNKTQEEEKRRHEYMWFILLMMQTNKIRPPFLDLPPETLPPLKAIVASQIYEDVLLSNDQAAFCFENEEEDPSKQVKVRSPPSKFFGIHPVPKDGIICYLAAFSDQSST